MDLNLYVPVTPADHRIGDLGAPIVLVEYGDYECPDCFNAYPLVQKVREELGERLCFVFRHFPLFSVHPHAGAAAQAAEAAARQGKYWEMHEILFRNQARLAEIDLTHLALHAGLELYQFQGDMERADAQKKIRDDIAGGTASGVTGTPSFFLNEKRYCGPIDAAAIVAAA